MYPNIYNNYQEGSSVYTVAMNAPAVKLTNPENGMDLNFIYAWTVIKNDVEANEVIIRNQDLGIEICLKRVAVNVWEGPEYREEASSFALYHNYEDAMEYFEHKGMTHLIWDILNNYYQRK